MTAVSRQRSPDAITRKRLPEPLHLGDEELADLRVVYVDGEVRGLCVNTCATLTPSLSLSEGEGAVSIPSPPEGERVGVRGAWDAEHAFVNRAG